MSQVLDNEINNKLKKCGLFPYTPIAENLKIRNIIERMKSYVTKEQLQEFLKKPEVYQNFNRNNFMS